MMTSKERVKRAIKFEQPDVIPVDYWILPATYLKHGQKIFELLEKYPADFPDRLGIEGPDFILPPSHKKGEYVDCFGCVWQQKHDGFLGQIIKHPLASLDDLKSYKFPEKEAGEVPLQQTKDMVLKFKKQGKYLAADFIRIFERMHFLRGMEEVLIDMAYQREEFFILRDAVVDWNISHLELVLKEDIDGVWFSDDWGTQTSLLISPQMWREFFKPSYKKMFDVVKAHNKDIFFHSDGYIMDIIDDLIEIGVDVLNCQINLLDARKLAERFGKRIIFHTDLDRQNILPYGTEEDVRKHIKEIVENLGRYSGGLILNAEIGPDVPYENIKVIFEEFDRVRKLK